MIEGMQRALDVSFLESVLVPIGGTEFALHPQSAPQLERVLNLLDEVNDIQIAEDTTDQQKQPWGSFLVKNYKASHTVIAMMFGFDPKSPEGKNAINHFNQHLAPKLAVRIYDEWRRVNEIDDFLLRSGRPLLHPDLVQRLKEMRIQEVQKLLSESALTSEAVEPVVTE